MKLAGTLRKMPAQHDAPVSYALKLGEHEVPLNALLGQQITLRFTGDIHCIACDRKIKKTFSQGYCFPCSQKLARCDMCIVRPERCHYDQGTCREPKWGEDNCLQPHVVYLASTSGLKVGITRAAQVPTRWIDQGASQALPIMTTSTRLMAGLVETTIAKHVADKTNWRTMLKGPGPEYDLPAERDRLLEQSRDALSAIQGGAATSTLLLDEEPRHFDYPVTRYPEKIKSLNWDKEPLIHDYLRGIKGQYLYFDSGVINMRKYAGYVVEVSTDSES